MLGVVGAQGFITSTCKYFLTSLLKGEACARVLASMWADSN